MISAGIRGWGFELPKSGDGVFAARSFRDSYRGRHCRSETSFSSSWPCCSLLCCIVVFFLITGTG